MEERRERLLWHSFSCRYILYLHGWIYVFGLLWPSGGQIYSTAHHRRFSQLENESHHIHSHLLSITPRKFQTQFPRDRHGRINTADVFQHIYRAVCLEKTRITLHFYDHEGKGQYSLPPPFHPFLFCCVLHLTHFFSLTQAP